MMDYNEDEFLLLSGIQHYAFCPRQWALIHIEQQWEENFFTIDGSIMHENAHDGELTEKRKNIIITRGMPIFSRTLGVSGNCDVVEFHKSEDGISLQNYPGTYLPLPIEYKRGKPKDHDADMLQLCAQAICLEEMLLCKIEKGYLFYGETKHRQEVVFEDNLRMKVREAFEKMHAYYDRKHTPVVKQTKSCKSCSLGGLCVPGLAKRGSVKAYIESRIKEKDGI